MKKAILAAGFALAMIVSASAQSKKKEPPPPPKPPKPPVEITNDVPPPPPPPVPPVPPPPPPMPTSLTEKEIASLPQDYQDFLKRNPSVGSLHWDDDEIFVVLKNGKVERYMQDETGVKQAEEKYGKLPEAPPPPPAPPAAPKPPRAPKNNRQ